MIIQLFEIALVSATLATGLVAGVFLTFSDFVMRALGRAKPAAGMEAMQMINREVYRSIFMALLMGLSLVSLLLAGAGLLLAEAGVAMWLVAAAVLYLAGVMAVTASQNVPMNQRLDAMKADNMGGHSYWTIYQRDWTRWNHLRWVTSLAASASYLGAVVTVAA